MEKDYQNGRKFWNRKFYLTFQWQEVNYLIKMTKDLAFLRQRRSANILTSSKFKSMTGKERVVALRQDDDRDTICLWCGLDPVTNPLLMLPPGHSVVQQLKEEKAAWDVELNKALHDEAEEIAQEYMRQRAKAQQDFVGRGVLTVDDDGDFKPQDDANNCANENTSTRNSDIIIKAEPRNESTINYFRNYTAAPNSTHNLLC